MSRSDGLAMANLFSRQISGNTQSVSERSSDGSWQHQRWPRAFSQHYFSIDEMTFADLMVMGRQIAIQTDYYRLDNSVDGNWEKLFTSDEAMVMAMILHQNVELIKAEFFNLEGQHPQRQWDYVIAQYALYDQYYRRANQGIFSAAKALAKTMKNQINQGLAEKLQILASMSGYYNYPCSGENGSTGQDSAQLLQQFDPVWGIHQSATALATDSSANASQWNNQNQTDSVVLNALYALLQSLQELKKSTAQFLQDSLNSQHHQGAIGLFMVFLRLYHQAQEGINHFTQRHIDFYYADVVHSTPRAAVPNKASITLLLEPGAKQPVLVSKGTHFSCGKDKDGQDIIYRADRDLWVRDISIESIKTLYLQRDNRISPEKYLKAVNRIKCNQLLHNGKEASSQIPIFGADKPNSAQSSGYSADIGFAVSSAVLCLAQGQRSVEITVRLTEPDMVYSYMQPISDDQPISCVDIFYGYLQQVEQWSSEGPQQCDQQAADIYNKLLELQLLDQTTAVDMAYAHPSQPQRLYWMFLLGKLLLSDNIDEQYLLFRKIFCRYLLCDDNHLLSLKIRALLVDHARELEQHFDLKADEDISLIGLLKLPRAQLFQRLLGRLFGLRLSTGVGWQALKNYSIDTLNPPVDPNGPIQYGFKLSFFLGFDFPPVVALNSELHGQSWCECGAPDQAMIQFRTGSAARFYPYSLFQDLALADITLDCRVHNLRQLQAYNHLGPLDISIPFMPFGTQPESESYLVIGSEEMASKWLSWVEIQLNWVDLPAIGGFGQYYQQYNTDTLTYSNDSFTMDLNILERGRWRQQSADQSLFVDAEPTILGTVADSSRFRIEPSLMIEPIGPSELPYAYSPDSRNGFFQIKQSESSAPFGQKRYPDLLSMAMIKNSEALLQRAKQQGTSSKSEDTSPDEVPILVTLPNPPYVPVLGSITLNYQAQATITLSGMKSDPLRYSNGRFTHISPFGLTVMDPSHLHQRSGRLMTLLPRYDHDGNLMIGFRSRQLNGKLSLYFNIGADEALCDTASEQRVSWQYLSATGWRTLHSQQVIQDDTLGLLRAGIITLALPSDMKLGVSDNQKLFWLCASADRDLEKYGNLISIIPHALPLTAIDPDPERAPEEFNWHPLVSIPGITAVNAAAQPFAGCASETRRQWLTRMSERLSHKQRAQTPLDFERLILQQFPYIARAKCFSHARWQHRDPQPGHVLIIVQHVSESQLSAEQMSQPPLVTGSQLAQINQYISQYISPFVSVDVRNPCFEKIQINCALEFGANYQSNKGNILEQLNRDVCAGLYPYDRHCPYRLFGWRMSLDDIYNIIDSLDYVEAVSELSILRIYQQYEGELEQQPQDNYIREQLIEDRGENGEILWLRPQLPWSLPLPVQQHIFHVIEQQSAQPDVNTGINRLEIGNTFIINNKTG